MPGPAPPSSGSSGSSSTVMASPNELFREHGHYEELALIGNGAYGTVYKARDLTNNGHIVALKKVRVPLTEDGVPMSTLREIALLRQLDQYEHPHIVRLLDICHGQRLEKEQQLVLFLVFEHVDQDLASYMERCPPPGLGSHRIKEIMHQILCGVDFLHTHRVIHRDLKPQNLLVTSTGNIKLADFGLAKTYDFEMRLTSVVVTLWYRSPEVLLGLPYATPVDIWSCGCIMAELFRLSPLFSGTSEGDQLDRIFRVIGTPGESEWPENVSLNWSSFVQHRPVPLDSLLPEICEQGQNFLQCMLRFDPSERVSAADALLHPYFRDSGLEPLQITSPVNRSSQPASGNTSEDLGRHTAIN
ncbi:cyclin-dependent kinase 4 isoform X2 [Periplaneta americana]|uniref:cyclin-dependent kinase 4 isoform X2 n=1 Tax=Periplaneta americana TaxID=6978 RepID=UPI0037E873A9